MLEIENDASKLTEYIGDCGAKIIAFDECARVGKTCRARQIAVQMNGTDVDLDCYLQKTMDRFAEAIRLGALRAAVRYKRVVT